VVYLDCYGLEIYACFNGTLLKYARWRSGAQFTASAGFMGYMVKINVINMQIAIKIKNINQEIMLICVFSFVVGAKSPFLLVRFLNNMEDSEKMETPIIPKIE